MSSKVALLLWKYQIKGQTVVIRKKSIYQTENIVNYASDFVTWWIEEKKIHKMHSIHQLWEYF